MSSGYFTDIGDILDAECDVKQYSGLVDVRDTEMSILRQRDCGPPDIKRVGL